MKYIRVLIVLFASYTITSGNLVSQSLMADVLESEFSNEMGFTVNIPRSYSEFDSVIEYKYLCRPRRFIGVTMYGLIKHDRNVIITFRFIKWDRNTLSEVTTFMRGINPNWDHNTEYLQFTKDVADTSKIPIKIFESEAAERSFNASSAVEFESNCTNSYMGMAFSKFLVINKDDRGYIAIGYHYNEGFKNKIENEIQATIRNKIVVFIE